MTAVMSLILILRALILLIGMNVTERYVFHFLSCKSVPQVIVALHGVTTVMFPDTTLISLQSVSHSY